MVGGTHRTMVTVVVVGVVVMWMVMGAASGQDADGMVCDSDQDCRANSTCVEDREGLTNKSFCQCIPTHKMGQSGDCLPNRIGDACRNNTDCSDVIDNAHCPSTAGKCRCKVGYLKNGGGDMCEALTIGSSCGWSAQCESVIDNSRCFGGNGGQKTCSCAKGYVTETNINDNGGSSRDKVSGSKNKDGDVQCVKSRLGSTCTAPVDCLLIGNHVTCLSGQCSCQTGYVETGDVGNTNNNNNNNNNNSNPCMPIPLHGICSDTKDCVNVPNAVCQQGLYECVCDDHYREDVNASRCIRKLLSTACDSVEHCPSTENTICDFDTGHCDCEKPFLPTEDGVGCYFRYVGDSCLTNDDCGKFVADSECSRDGICSCQGDLLPNGNHTKCLVPIIGKASCSTHEDCLDRVVNSYCRNEDRVCACRKGHGATKDLNRCEEKSLLDECSSNEDCVTMNPSSECVGNPGTCQCVSGYIMESPEGVKPVCRRRVLGRHPCQTKSDCSDAESDSECVTCGGIDILPPYCDAECGEDAQNCTARTCQCEIGFLSPPGDNSCQRRHLWDTCSMDDDCSASVVNSECVRGGICLCQSGFRPILPDTCQKRSLNDSCRTDQDCEDAIPHTVCLKNHHTAIDSSSDDVSDHDNNGFGSCDCRSGFKVVNGTKCQRRQIGDRTCTQHSDCDDAVSGSMCSSGMCVCRLGYFPGFDLYSCTARTLHGPYCTAHRDCNSVIANAQCSNSSHSCVCQTGYRVESDVECVRLKLDDAGCRDDADCADSVENSVCSIENASVPICACDTGYHPDFVSGEDCAPRNISGHPCETDEDCSRSVANSFCSDEQCECLSGFYHTEEGTLCNKRIIGDECNVTSDCADVINNSTCAGGVCECDPTFEPNHGLDGCFLIPKQIGSPCFYDGHCKDVHKYSVCSAKNDDVIKKCVCPNDTFVGVSQNECVKMPKKVGDRCRFAAHCADRINNTLCRHGKLSCACHDDFFQDEGGLTCTPFPKQLGDRCLPSSKLCSMSVKHSVCDDNNDTCVCMDGFTQVSGQECTERPRIPPYPEVTTPPETAECNSSCENIPNSRCVATIQKFVSHCECIARFAYPQYKNECQPVQTYLYKARLTEEASTYDYENLIFKMQYNGPNLPAYKTFARRVIYNGINNIMLNTTYKERLVSSQVLSFKSLNKQANIGVEVSILIHLQPTPRYFRATPVHQIDGAIIKELRRTNKEFGESRLLVGSSLKRSSVVTDFDECQSPDHNDCSSKATCVNTVGSFMCLCLSDHVDESAKTGKRRGRVCEMPVTKATDSAVCSNPDCGTSWEFVGLVLTLFFLIVIAFIVYEIIQRKQNFNARKLYERFGTTRIRRLKLTTAGLKRLQERKKYRKKYKKRMKKEMKKNKKKKRRFGRKGKGSGAEDSDGEKSAPPTPNVMDTEEMSPSPLSEIIHQPTVPIIDNDDDDDDDNENSDDMIVVVSDGDGAGGAAGGSGYPEVAGVRMSNATGYTDDSVTVFIDD